MVFNISSEFKTIPTWFNDFEPKKLIDHPVNSIKYTIWLIQLGSLASILVSVSMSAFTLFAGLGGLVLFFSLIGIVLSQTLILGIHARSRLAWLFLACNVLRFTFSYLFIIGLVMWFLLDDEETVNYFNGKQAPDLIENH